MDRSSGSPSCTASHHNPGGGGIKEEEDDDDDERVVIEQRLLRIGEVFVYRIPPMRSADGHRAEDWNLARPLATCSLVVVRRDDMLLIDLMADRQRRGAPAGAMETYPFARCEIRPDVSAGGGSGDGRKLEYWVNPAVDTSRYFAVRIKDSRTGREAFIGVGFRERADATNFRMCLDDYVDSLKREKKAEELRRQFEELSTTGRCSNDGGSDSADVVEAAPPPKSSLSLKEGEKLHINIVSKRANSVNKHSPKVKGTGALNGLKKPPPPPENTPAADSSSEQGLTAAGATSEIDVDWGDFEG
ncbi:hypothetical protein ACHAXA_004823 [Cyclostephanos tholiformis]|uniref:NECAP PHear domain-containing protein n=1 Tax=Cyclostephanos tholiformis TaxID=382380 RepID=A0ABD3SGP8_9STRA